MSVEITDAFRKGSRGAASWTFSGTFVTERPLEPEAIGKSFSVPAASYFRFRGRRIRDAEDFYDLADLMRQLGLPAGPYTPPQP